MSDRSRPVVAIDGPAGAGKSTAAAQLAERLGFVRVDTGALYRGTAYIAKQAGLALSDGVAVGAALEAAKVEFVLIDGAPRLHIDGVDREGDIRTPAMSEGASVVSQHPEVRAALLGLQRNLGKDGGVVLEGRDIGTVVFPKAEVKIYLDASSDERARRRVAELESRGMPADFDETKRAIEERDQKDKSREIAPLTQAPDATLVDTSEMDLPHVVDALEALVRRAMS